MAEDAIRALEILSGVTSAICASRKISESEKINFTGSWSHLGTVTIGQALDMADSALGKAKQQ